ncbi:hypothetical protein COY07_03845, partial [Candidatus Peregrinibacteria bacterium CG_4_10_14_0_2_um_filter_43_11]
MIKLPKKIKVKKNGFSLVELIIATGMAALIMMGMSVFFSGTLKNTFSAQKQVTENQSQFVTGVIVREKFLELQSVLNNFTVNQSYIVALNKTKANQLPFTYIGTANVGGKTRLVFKDAFAFGEVASIGISQQCGNPGSGTILNCASNASTVNGIPKNFAGFTKKGNDYYIAIPDQNKILTCVGGGGTYCTPGNSIISDDTLNQPMDVETDGTNLFISDAGNGRVVQVDGSGTMTVLAKNLKFPTGLAYYKKKDSGHEFLFVADSFDNKIKKIDLGNIDEDTEPEVIVGMGSETTCQGSAKYCALNFPTGLFVINVPNPINPQDSQIDLYIADSGNNRILKVKDPGKPDTMTFKFKTGATNEPLKKIVLSFPEGIDASQAKLDSIESSSNTLNLEGEW